MRGECWPKNTPGRRGMAAHLGDAEADLVQQLAELVQRVEADRVDALASAAVVEDHRALHAQAARDEVDAHVVHADARVALEPDLSSAPAWPTKSRLMTSSRNMPPGRSARKTR